MEMGKLCMLAVENLKSIIHYFCFCFRILNRRTLQFILVIPAQKLWNMKLKLKNKLFDFEIVLWIIFLDISWFSIQDELLRSWLVFFTNSFVCLYKQMVCFESWIRPSGLFPYWREQRWTSCDRQAEGF